MINRLKSIAKKILSGEDDDKKIIVLSTGEQKPDLDLRIVGLFSNVDEEKVSEIVTGLLYMNALNKAAKEEDKKKITKLLLKIIIILLERWIQKLKLKIIFIYQHMAAALTTCLHCMTL